MVSKFWVTIGLHSKQPVTRIPQTRDDVPASIKAAINRSSKDWQARIMPANVPDSLGCSDKIDQYYVPRPESGEQLHRCHGAASGSEHRVNEDDLKRAKIPGQTLVIGGCAEGSFFALQADEADPRVRNQLQNGIQHAEPGPQNWYENNFPL